MKTKLLLVLGITLVCISCKSDDRITENEQENLIQEEGSTTPKEPDLPGDIPDDAELIPNTQSLVLDNCVSINFQNADVNITNPFENNGVTVENNDGHVIVKSTITDKELNYVLSGITSSGSIKIYGEYKFNLYLNGVGITNPKGGAINIQCGKKITVTVVDNTQNRLIDAATYEQVTGEDMKGTFFSEGQLNFYGTGSLEIRGKYKHGICVDDYLHIYEGNIIVKEAASDAFHANDYIRIDAGTLLVKSIGDGLDCEKGYITINGGTLEITTEGEKGHAIKSATSTTVNSIGKITLKVSGNASKGFSCNGDMTIIQGDISITTAGDAMWDTSDSDISSASGIKCDGNLTIDGGDIAIASTGKGGKGISVDGELVVNGGNINVSTSGGRFTYGQDDTSAKAIKSDGNMTINSGNIIIKTSGTEAEGLESKATLTINSGVIEIEAYDDCINAENHIEFTGGKVYCSSKTNDGIDSNGTLTISGGIIISASSGNPEGGFDCDQSRFSITGGIIIGIGGSTSTPTTSACTQYSLIYGANLGAGSIIYIESDGGKETLTFRLPKASTTMLFSSSALIANTEYTIYSGGSINGENSFHGLYTGATYSKGTAVTSFTTSSMVTRLGNTGGRF